MALSEFESKRFEKPVKAYCDSKYPANIRDQLYLDYEIKDQSIILFTVRPRWNNPLETVKGMIAKATYVKSKKVWKLYWQRADLKWHGYPPKPEVKSVEEFLRVVEADDHGCFYG
jgi:hypothetical protein